MRLGDHVVKIGSGATPLGGQASYIRDGIPLIRSQNVHMNRFAPEGLAFITAEQDQALSSSRVEPDDVLLNITGASIGRVCVVPGDTCPANVNQHVCIIRGDGSFEPAFLALYISTPDFQRWILESQAGATRQALTKGMVEGFRVPLPPLPEQKHIAALLAEQMAAVARARAAAEAQVGAARALPAAYLRQVFESGEARGWPTMPLRGVADLLPARTIATEGDTEVVAVTTACLSETGFDPSGAKRARMWAGAAVDAVVSIGEVLVARSNTPDLVGRAAMFGGEPEGAVASDLTIRVMPRSPLQPPFLAAYLSYLYITGYWRTRSGGASGSMKKITRRQVMRERVPVPSVDEQARVTDSLRARLSEVTALQARAATQCEHLVRLPAALLRHVFTLSGAL